MTASASDPTQAAPELLDRRAVRSASSSVTGMTIFVASEAVFFAAFFGIYAVSYAAAANWPPVGVVTPSLVLPSIALAVLLVSGLTMTRCLRTIYHKDYPRGLVPWLAATIVGSALFAVLVLLSLYDANLSIGQGVYQSLFYVITALEFAHAVGGAMLCVLVLLRAGTGELALRTDPIQAAAIYWYFVVALGVAIYLILYVAVL